MLSYEVIWKRETAINQLKAGLETLDVLSLAKRYPETFIDKFVAVSVSVTKDRLLQELCIASPKNDEEHRTLEFFHEYLSLDGYVEIGPGGLSYQFTSHNAFISLSVNLQLYVS